MATPSMKDMVNSVSVNKGRGDKAKEYAKASEWPKCCIAGCPLQTTIKDDRPTCNYHHRENGYSATCITEAVKEFAPYLKKYAEMIHWNVRQWKENEPKMMGWPVLPATRLEMDLPTLYLTRFKKFIDDGIKNKADEIYNNQSI